MEKAKELLMKYWWILVAGVVLWMTMGTKSRRAKSRRRVRRGRAYVRRYRMKRRMRRSRRSRR